MGRCRSEIATCRFAARVSHAIVRWRVVIPRNYDSQSNHKSPLDFQNYNCKSSAWIYQG